MTLNELQALTRRLTNTTSTEYSDTNLNASLTSGAHFLMSEVFDAMDDWDIKGEIATTNLVDGQNEYVFPSDIAKIKRIEVSYDGTNWYKVKFFDVNEKQSALTGKEDSDYAKQEPYAEIFDNSIFLYPTPDANATAGLKIWYSKESVGTNDAGEDISSFSTSTDKPILRPAFQKGLVFIASIDYFTQFKDWESVTIMEQKLEKIIARMRTFYGNRISDRKVVVQGNSSLENYE